MIGFIQLEWERDGGDLRCRSVAGRYEILKSPGRWTIFRDAEGVSFHSNERSAIDAAQADFEARVGSAVVTSSPLARVDVTTATEITVTVSGPVGCGKSAVAGEIEIALRAVGVQVRMADAKADREEKNMTGADWTGYIEMYQPSVVIVEAIAPINTKGGSNEH